MVIVTTNEHDHICLGVIRLYEKKKERRAGEMKIKSSILQSKLLFLSSVLDGKVDVLNRHDDVDGSEGGDVKMLSR